MDIQQHFGLVLFICNSYSLFVLHSDAVTFYGALCF